MPFPLYQIDSFTDKLFGGNPAAVCLLQDWLPDTVLLQIAAENFLPETAFLLPSSNQDRYKIRWFTPEIEMDLCGHATLAAAHVIFKHLGLAADRVVFSSASGEINVTRQGSLLTLDFPSRMPVTAELPEIILRGMGRKPLEVLKARDYVLVYDSEETVRALQPNRVVLDQINLDPGGIIATAKGETADFVSRFFTPQASIFEDPVTGSAHCSLIPYWSQQLRKKELTALQVSARTGTLCCTDKEDRVLIGGTCVTYMQGNIYI
ncbi:PhzF family phenazine biosynthesis protein [Pontibacter pamirensis]|uniref:PhzF family phenazine biosynthesis protein n=1 Tax=Pontibacter pamirensis TaxID=2562824 RepID=UPI001389C308|nr:PhzF family phenazine biosynthesis protein [Pontibacter pamirensis]